MKELNHQPKLNEKKGWWEKPGLGLMYQIESRPGWIWNRNFNKFNATMIDEEGKLKFNGPLCKMKKWVEFSKKVGVQYHVFEAKWHDGICYFDSEYTEWKTPVDYCKIYAEESKKADIPFMFYYSSIFDHNPQFDEIQPLRCITPSFIAMHHENKEKIAKYSMNFAKVIEKMVRVTRNERRDYNLEFFDEVEFHDFTYNPEQYERYLLNQINELIEKYKPDGMWMDWYWGKEEASTFLVMNFMENNYSDVILTYNNSIERNPRYIHYLSGEAHDIDTAWKAGNRHRSKKKAWELCGPAAYAWDVPLARSDPYEIFRIAVIIMASGGKFCFGLPAQMNGELYPEPAKNVELFGEWYNLRKDLFTNAVPMVYKGKAVPGIEVEDDTFGIIGTIHNDNKIIHIINFKGILNEIKLTFNKEYWGNIEKIIHEPYKEQLVYKSKNNVIEVIIKREKLDLVDNILRIIEN